MPFFGVFSLFVAGVGVGVGDGVVVGGGLRLMAPVAAANHDFNDFQHWLRLGCWSVNWASGECGARKPHTVRPAERFIEPTPLPFPIHERLQLIF